jgi:hypothetical protein
MKASGIGVGIEKGERGSPPPQPWNHDQLDEGAHFRPWACARRGRGGVTQPEGSLRKRMRCSWLVDWPVYPRLRRTMGASTRWCNDRRSTIHTALTTHRPAGAPSILSRRPKVTTARRSSPPRQSRRRAARARPTRSIGHASQHRPATSHTSRPIAALGPRWRWMSGLSPGRSGNTHDNSSSLPQSAM